MNLLLVEDNKRITEVIFDYFEIKGISLDYAHNGSLGLELASNNFYDLIILDIMLPKMDGFTLCQRLRNLGIATPVLMLTARGSSEDIVTGFEQGADDYLVKPFDLEVLEARVNALIRRSRGENHKKSICYGPLSLDLESHTVKREDKTIPLNPAQFSLLRLLMTNAPKLVTRQQLINALWGLDEPDSDLLRSHIYQLRSVVDKPFKQACIKTLPKTGYQLIIPDEN